MIAVLQVMFVLGLIVLIILFVFETRRKVELVPLPDDYRDVLDDYVKFYRELDASNREKFEERLEHFLSTVTISGVNAQVEDLDRILIGAGAIIPVFAFPDWQYINLHEILLYPGTFNEDYDQAGRDRHISGMVGSGAMQNVMILSKWQLRQGFINGNEARNTAIHEFVHLVDKMDGTVDGIPEIILERKYVPRWSALISETIRQIRAGHSDIDPYGATNEAEFFAVVSEYFFEQPEKLRMNHPELFEMLERIFRTQKSYGL